VSDILLHARYGALQFIRTPIALFFSLVFPVGLYLLFGTLFGQEPYAIQALTANLLIFGNVAGSFTGLAISMVEQREEGMLKRLRGTPLRPWRYLVAQALVYVALACVIGVVIMVVGVLVFDLQVVWRLLPAALLVLVAGTLSLCLLGLAISAVTPTVEAATAVTNAVTFPLLFASGLFLPLEILPSWLARVASVFPLLPLGRAMRGTFDDAAAWPGFAWTDLAIVAAWGLAGLLLAARFFRWTPREASAGRRRRRPGTAPA
jgi:ABC-2 type transport system permease protein